VRVLAKSCSPNAIRCLAEIPQCWATSRLSLKSLVWYRPEEFDRLSLEVPATLSELEEMVVEMREQGATPWCFGLAAQGAAGWAATDWIEDMVLRMSGPDIYERWMAGDVAFSDPAIREPFEAFRSLVLVPGSVAGGIPGVLRTSVSDSASGLFGEPADCVLHRQASYVTTQMHTVDGNDICRVHIKPCGFPVDAKVTEIKKGQHVKAENFYTRINNGTHKFIDDDQKQKYISQRWPSQ